jgi:hypothetical protein
MHSKYGPQGLVAVSVSLDRLEGTDEEKKETKQGVVDFLRSKGAAFPNYLLDEDNEVWQKRLHSDVPPIVFVFNREGKWTQFKADDVADHYEKIENLVAQLLKTP